MKENYLLLRNRFHYILVEQESSLVVARNNVANQMDQVGFILTVFQEFGKVT